MLYVFGECTLDTQRYELRHAGGPIPLRRKAFQVLAYLLAHADRVIAKQELCEQVWPQQFISDAALESTIKAVRQAIGDSGRGQRLIQTVYGQGYRCVVEVTLEDQAPPDRATLLAPARASVPRLASRNQGQQRLGPTMVGRETALAQLSGWFAQAQDGARHIVFVTGEPGIGKTTLVDAFLSGLAGEEPLWIGRGQCVEQFGAGEAYRPVLEALGRLGRGSCGQEVVTLLAQQAPTWLVQMPGLIGAADLEALQRRLAGATRDRMLRELAEALELLTARQPLVLVLEDLHWSDPSTLDLLAVLARRREPARLLLIGTYRPPEGRRRAHPLQSVIQELQLHGHSVELSLPLLPEDAIAAYLATRFPGLPRIDELARLLHQHTEGNPLFMVTLVDAWLTHGVLRDQDGAWALSVGVEALEDEVPDSLHQMIAGQLDRLSAEEQRVLEAGSAAGVEFSAAAVAAGLAQEVERVDDACAALARRGQWLQAVGEHSWPDGTVAGGYCFSHALYQQVLYRRVSAARRVRLHQRIGEREEVGYGAQAGARAAALAVHFAQGRDYPRAVQYLRQAGENAIQRSSYQEAITHLTKGLDLLPLLPDTPERTQHELRLHVTRGVPLMLTQGYAAQAVEQTFQRARALCQEIGETPQLFPVLLGLARFYITRAEYQIAYELGEQLVRLAHHAHDPVLCLQAHEMVGATLCFRGECVPARIHLEQSLALYDPQQCRALSFLHGEDPGVVCLSLRTLALWTVGYPDQALHSIEEALRLAQELAHPMSLAHALLYAAVLHQLRREQHVAQARAEALMTLVNEQGFTGGLGMGTILQGWALATQGQSEEGLTQLRQGVTAMQATGQKAGAPHFLALLAEAYGIAGQVDAGLGALAEALEMAHLTGGGYYEPELSRLRGELLLVQAGQRQKGKGKGPMLAEAESCFQQALTVARRQQAKSLELRAAMSLGRLWQRHGQCAEARQLLAEIYDWFSEGFDTADLQEAKALLAAWA